jgi:hypothetical protein
MATTSDAIEPNRQECPNRCDLGDRFYIKEPIAWVTCIITRPRDNLEHREKFTLDRGVYQPVFSGLTNGVSEWNCVPTSTMAENGACSTIAAGVVRS